MIKANTNTPGIMYVAANGDLSAITLLDTDPTTPISRLWSVTVWPDNLTSAPIIASNTSNPATFTPPAAGEYYVIDLARTTVAGVSHVQLVVCIPDADGNAIPAPAIAADPDPTKSLFNLNDRAKAVGWAGGSGSGVPGLSGYIRKLKNQQKSIDIGVSVVSATNTTNDHPNISAALLNTRALLLPGTPPFLVDSKIALGSNKTVIGDPSTIVKSTIPNVAFASNAFDCEPTQLTSGTVASNAAVGDTTIQVTISPAPTVGQCIGFIHEDEDAFYDVLAVSGAGPYTVTLDRPLFIPFASGDIAGIFDEFKHDVTIDGRGMQVSGSGNHAILITDVRRPVVRGVRLVDTYGVPDDAGIGCDGCLEPLIEDCGGTRRGAAQNGPVAYLQTAERGLIRRCVGYSSAYGAYLSDCNQSGIEDFWSFKCSGAGTLLITLDAAGVNHGNKNVWIRGGGDIGSAVGISVFGTNGAVISDWSGIACIAQGIIVNSGGGVNTENIRFAHIATLYCDTGVLIQAGSGGLTVKGISFEDLDVSNSISYGLHSTNSDDGVTVRGLVAKGFSGSAVPIRIEAGKLWLSDVVIESTSTVHAMQLEGSRHSSTRGRVLHVADAVASILAAGITEFRDYEIDYTSSIAGGFAIQSSDKLDVIDSLLTVTGVASGASGGTFAIDLESGRGSVRDSDIVLIGANGVLAKASVTLQVRGGSLTASGGSETVFYLNGSSHVIENYEIDYSGAPALSVAIVCNASITIIRNSKINGQGDCIGIEVISGAVLYLDGIVEMSGWGESIVLDAGATCRLGGNLRLTGGALVASAGSYLSIGEVTATTVVPWPDLNANDRVILTLKTRAGTQATPVVTLNPGTGFTITYASLDTSTYQWRVVSG